jgi:hypothetical protein
MPSAPSLRETYQMQRSRDCRKTAGSLDYFETCRRKRNVIDYDHAFVATKTEAEEIVAEAQAFFKLVENWTAAHHPKLTP